MAFVKHGNSIIATSNCSKSSPKFLRYYEKGHETLAYSGHAEMILADRVKFKKGDIVYVARFLRDGTATMARPCRFCQKHLYDAGITRVRYTDWSGKWRKMTLLPEPY